MERNALKIAIKKLWYNYVYFTEREYRQALYVLNYFTFTNHSKWKSNDQHSEAASRSSMEIGEGKAKQNPQYLERQVETVEC